MTVLGQDVLDAMLDVVVVVDVEGRILMSNLAAARVSGYPAEQLAGMPIAMLLDDERSGLRTRVRERIAEGASLRREESWLLTRTGARVPISVSGAPAFDGAGAFVGIVLVARDVSELQRLLQDRQAELDRRHAVERELRTLNASVEQKLDRTRTALLLSERRATLGTLAGGLGYELDGTAARHRRALTVLQQQAASLTGEARAALLQLSSACEEVAAYARRLMHLARPGPDHERPLNLNRVISDCAAMLQGAGKLHQIELVLALPDDPVLVTVNKARIEQIVVNLVVNAAEAIGERRGQILLAVHTLEDGRHALIEISDTGPGIAPAVLPRIFEPFYTTKSDDVSGLGLAVAREVVEHYGGTLTAKSTVGVGSTFTFDLPISTSR